MASNRNENTAYINFIENLNEILIDFNISKLNHS